MEQAGVMDQRQTSAGQTINVTVVNQEQRDELVQRLPPASLGWVFRPLRQLGLGAASGATDFGGLFIGFSLFLIVSAAMLVGLLFGLGVEQRAKQIGLLRAVGYPLGRIRWGLLAEGSLLAALGGLLGTLGGIAYAWLMMAGLRSLWLPAVGSFSSRTSSPVSLSQMRMPWSSPSGSTCSACS